MNGTAVLIITDTVTTARRLFYFIFKFLLVVALCFLHNAKEEVRFHCIFTI